MKRIFIQIMMSLIIFLFWACSEKTESVTRETGTFVLKSPVGIQIAENVNRLKQDFAEIYGMSPDDLSILKLSYLPVKESYVAIITFSQQNGQTADFLLTTGQGGEYIEYEAQQVGVRGKYRGDNEHVYFIYRDDIESSLFAPLRYYVSEEGMVKIVTDHYLGIIYK